MKDRLVKIVDLLFEEIDAAVERRLGSVENPSAPRPAGIVVDDATRETIQQFQVLCQKPYLDKEEAAIYLGCSGRSLDEWAARPVTDNPLPVGFAGSHMRVKREKLDQWVEREAQRKRLKMAS